VKILFASGFAPIVRDRDASLRFYEQTPCLPLDRDDEYDYVSTGDLEGLKHFGLWPLSEAAELCFGTKEWPADVPVPHGTLEFDVDNVDDAAAELQAEGYSLVHEPMTTPWGQRIVHVMSPENILIGLSYTPAMRDT